MSMVETTAASEEVFALRTYLNVLQRRWRLVVAVMLAALVVAMAMSLRQEKQYHVEADLLLSRSTVSIGGGNSTDAYLQTLSAGRLLANDVETLESGTTRDAVAARYDGALDPEDVTV